MEGKEVVFLIDKIDYGGAQVGLERLLSGVCPSDLSINIVTFNVQSEELKEEFPESIEIINLEIASPIHAYKLKKLFGILDNTDYLICSLEHSVIFGTLFGKICDVPNIYCWQHTTVFPTRIKKYLSIICFYFCDRVLADSKSVEDMLSEVIFPSKISVLPLAGTDTDEFYPIDEYRRFNGKEVVDIGTVGRAAPVKGYDYLIDCAKKLGSEYQFHIVGATSSEVEEVYSTQLPSNVSCYGKIEHSRMAEFYNSIDIYFQPSNFEGLCIAVIEAMCCGKPVVASSVGGITESVNHKSNGFLCEPGAITEYINGIQFLCEFHPTYEPLCSISRERAETEYSESALSEQFLELLNT